MSSFSITPPAARRVRLGFSILASVLAVLAAQQVAASSSTTGEKARAPQQSGQAR